jgi:addiction module RelE/StbE family toxin
LVYNELMFQKIEYLPRVLKQLKKVPKIEQRKILKKIEILAEDPFIGKNLHGRFSGTLSIRAWPYRIIYQIKKDSILVFSVKHRQEAYKK